MRIVNKFANDYDFLISCGYITIFGINIWLFLIENFFLISLIFDCSLLNRNICIDTFNILSWIMNFICAISILIIDKR